MHYEIHGEGENLVLIPGFASGAWSWTWQVDDLAKRFRVITFDPTGISKSIVQDGETVSIASAARDVVALLDELRIESAHVLGISYGGFVALELALHFPDRVHRLVLASTSFGGANHVAPSMSVLSAFASTDGLNTRDRIQKYLRVAFSAEFDASNRETVDRFCTMREENVVPKEIYMQQLQSALSFDVERDVSKIRSETLVISGDTDVVVPVENSHNLAAAIPNATLAIIAGAGHMAFVEKASEFNLVVGHFLEGRS